MIRDVLANRMKEYAPANALEQENVLQEILQQFVLASLSRARFFSHAIFHGGTCLRILYGMNRFSEDLDFVLKERDATFKWEPYLECIRRDCAAEGIHFDVQGRDKAETAVRKVFLKTDSIGQILNLELPFGRHTARKIRIKLEVDTNPPSGATFESKYIIFPVPAAITSMDLASGFGSKSHALLCREYTKGRDWYDFLWYASRKVVPNLNLLSHAMDQQGPWAGHAIAVSTDWFLAAMQKRIGEIDWRAAARDVARFVMIREQESLQLWSEALFRESLNGLAEQLREAK